MTLDHQDSPEPLKLSPSRVSIVVAWILILGLVSLVAFRNARSGVSTGKEDPLAEQKARLVALLSIQLKMLNAAGNDQLQASSRAREEQLLKDLEREARTPRDHIRIAVIRGELRGADEALNELKSIGPVADAEVSKDIATLRSLYRDGPNALDSTARERLDGRYGVLGKIALSYGVAASAEPRKSILSSAFLFTMRVVVVAAGFLMLMFGSIALFVLAIVWFVRRKFHAAYASDFSVQGVFLEAFAIYLILYVAMGAGLRLLGAGSIHWIWLALLILPVIAIWARWRGVTAAQFRQALGWHTGRGVLREMAAGFLGYVGGLVFVAVGAVMTYFLVRYSGTPVSSPVVEELRGGIWHILGVYGAACVFAPVMEETMFRGALFHHMRRRWNWAFSALVVALIFAILHPQGWAAVPVLSSLAIVFAGIREWRGSLIACMTAHACNNFIVLTITLLLLK